MITPLLLCFQAITFPSTWHVQAGSVALPEVLKPISANACMVGLDGDYLYTPTARIDLKTGKAKSFWVYRRIVHRGNSDEALIFVSWRHLSGDVEESTVESFFYADGEEIGVKIPTRSRSGVKPAFYFLGKIDSAPKFPSPNLSGFLRKSLSWYYPTSFIYGEGLIWSGTKTLNPAFLHGTKPDVIVLPRNMADAIPITSGIIWDRKVGFVLWGGGSSDNLQQYYSVNFSSKQLKLTRLRSPRLDLTKASGYFPFVLEDESIGVPLHGAYPPNRPAEMKYMHGTGIYDPKVGKWKYYDGLVVWGTSHDNHLVAFSEYPWKTIQVARVDAPTKR